MMPEKYGSAYMYGVNFNYARNIPPNMPYPIRNTEHIYTNQVHRTAYGKCHLPVVEHKEVYPPTANERPAIDLRTMDNPDFIPVSRRPGNGSCNSNIRNKPMYSNFPNYPQHYPQYNEPPNLSRTGNCTQNYAPVFPGRIPTYQEHIMHQAGETMPSKTDIMYDKLLSRLYEASLSKRNDVNKLNEVNTVLNSPWDEIAYQKEINKSMLPNNHIDLNKEVSAPVQYYGPADNRQCMSSACAHKACSVMSQNRNQSNRQVYGNHRIENKAPGARYSTMRFQYSNQQACRGIQNQEEFEKQLQGSSNMSTPSSRCSSTPTNQEFDKGADSRPYPSNIKPLEMSVWIKAIEQVFAKELGQIDRTIVSKHIAEILNKDKGANEASIMAQLKQLLEGLKVESLLNNKKSTKSANVQNHHLKQDGNRGFRSTGRPEDIDTTMTTSAHKMNDSGSCKFGITSHTEGIEDTKIKTKIEYTPGACCGYKNENGKPIIKHEMSDSNDIDRKDKFKIKQESELTMDHIKSLHIKTEFKRDQILDSVRDNIERKAMHERKIFTEQQKLQHESLCIDKVHEGDSSTVSHSRPSPEQNSVVVPTSLQENQQCSESSKYERLQQDDGVKNQNSEVCSRKEDSMSNTRRQSDASVTDLAKRLIEEELRNLKSASSKASENQCGEKLKTISESHDNQERHNSEYQGNFSFLRGLSSSNVTQYNFGLTGEVMRDLLNSRKTSQKDNLTDQSNLSLVATSDINSSTNGKGEKRKRDEPSCDSQTENKLKFRKSPRSADKERSSNNQELFATTDNLVDINVIDVNLKNNQQEVTLSQDLFDSLFS